MWHGQVQDATRTVAIVMNSKWMFFFIHVLLILLLGANVIFMASCCKNIQ